MTDTLTTQPIVNGSTQLVYGAYLATTAIEVSGTQAVMPCVPLWANGTVVATGNSLPVFDALVVTNTGSILTESLALVSQGSTEIALLGSINTALAGTLVTSPSVPVTHTLAAGGTVSTGTPINLLSAGQAGRGGLLQTESATGFYVNVTGANAGTVVAASTVFVPQGTIFPLPATANAVSVNSTATVTLGGYGLS